MNTTTETAAKAATGTATRIHPLVATAAIAVTTVSLAGIAALTGLLPMAKSDTTAAVPPAQVATAPADAVPPAPTFSAPPAVAEPSPVEKSAAPASAKPAVKPVSKPAPKPVTKAAATTSPAPAPLAEVTQPAPVAPPAPAAPPPCLNCGVVDNVREFAQEGEGTGLGAVAGGVIGGLLGNQVGGGSGKKVATVLGAAGGAYAGHQVEKSQKKTTRYEISVRMNDGSIRKLTQDTVPAWRIGEHVRVENDGLVRDN